MAELWLIALAAVSALNTVALVWLMVTHGKLKRDYLLLNETVNRQGLDISGLCSAAINVDEHVGLTEQQLIELWEKVADVQANSHTGHTYSNDIQKVRSGASVHELMQSSGMSHDEAALLIRLHGAKPKL